MVEARGRPEFACDVAVVGAGPAGAATARWLARAGCRVVLLERGLFDAPRAGESLAPAVQPLLRALGVWRAFEALEPVPSYGTRSVWGDPQPSAHSHLLTPYGQGFHVERRAFDRMLADSAVDAGAELWRAARVTRCAPFGDGWELSIARSGASAVSLRAAFVVDAAGRSSPVARWLGARRVLFDRLIGIGASFDCEAAGEQGFTLVEAGAFGWWYSAPCTRERLVAMLMTDGNLESAARARTLEGFDRVLASAELTGARARGARRAGSVHTFSAVSQRLVRAELQARWLAVGDAALSVDPISGSGVVRALRSAREAAGTALAALSGEPDAVARYENACDQDCTAYLHERAAYYALEQRFPEAEFWRRRIQPPKST